MWAGNRNWAGAWRSLRGRTGDIVDRTLWSPGFDWGLCIAAVFVYGVVLLDDITKGDWGWLAFHLLGVAGLAIFLYRLLTKPRLDRHEREMFLAYMALLGEKLDGKASFLIWTWNEANKNPRLLMDVVFQLRWFPAIKPALSEAVVELGPGLFRGDPESEQMLDELLQRVRLGKFAPWSTSAHPN